MPRSEWAACPWAVLWKCSLFPLGAGLTPAVVPELSCHKSVARVPETQGGACLSCLEFSALLQKLLAFPFLSGLRHVCCEGAEIRHVNGSSAALLQRAAHARCDLGASAVLGPLGICGLPVTHFGLAVAWPCNGWYFSWELLGTEFRSVMCLEFLPRIRLLLNASVRKVSLSPASPLLFPSL